MDLVEKIAKEKFERCCKSDWSTVSKFDKRLWIKDSLESIKTIKQNIHEVAEVCPECEAGRIIKQKCCVFCKGHGIIAKDRI